MKSSRLKSASLLLLRIGSGLLLIIWGALRVTTPAAGPGLADKYYSGLLNTPAIQLAFGAGEILVGALVVLGLLRRFAFPLQALVLIPGALVLWRYLVDPLGWYLLDRESTQILFFPSITVAAASLALIAFRDDDRWSLDRLLAKPAA